MVDTLASGASGGNPVEVQVLSWAPFIQYIPVAIQICLHALFPPWPRCCPCHEENTRRTYNPKRHGYIIPNLHAVCFSFPREGAAVNCWTENIPANVVSADSAKHIGRFSMFSVGMGIVPLDDELFNWHINLCKQIIRLHFCRISKIN